MTVRTTRILFSLALWQLLAVGEPTFAVENTAGESAEPTVAAAHPTGILTLQDAVSAALVSSPRLAAFSWEVRSRDARAVQAGLLPNPQILVEVENLGGSGDRAAFEQGETTVWLSQLIPLAGKPAKRRRVAELDRDLSQWEYEGTRLSVLTDTTKAFIATLAAQQQLELLRELEELAGASVRQVTLVADAGGASMVEKTRAEVELSSIRLRRQQAEGQLAANRASLASSWGSATADFTSVAGDLADVVPAPALEDLVARVRENPDLARWATELDRRSAALSLAEARRIPDPTLSLGGRYFNDNGDSALVVAVTIPIPVFDRNQGNVLAATSDLSKARAEKASSEVSVQALLQQRHAALAAAYRQAETLRRDTLPAARETYAGVREGYRRGLFRSLDVLDAQRTLFELRSQYFRTLATYQLARADVERLTASPLGVSDVGEAR